MQVIKVTAAVLISVLCAWVMLRFYGLSQQYQSFDHPVMKLKQPWIIAWGGELEDGPSHSSEALQGAAKQEEVILAINVQINADKHFFAIPPNFKIGNKKIDLSQYSDFMVKSLDLGEGKNPISLEQVLEEFGQKPILIWISDNLENIDLRIEPILKKYKSHSSILIHSEFDNVLKSVKKLIPDLIFGTGVGQRIRVLMLGSIGLESVSTIDGDFLVTPLFEGKVRTTSIEMKDEVARRQKIFILGPLNDTDANNQALNYGAMGYLTSYPRDLKKKLKSTAQTL